MKFKRRFRRKFKYNKKRSFMFILFFLICLSFGLGYSLIQTDINIFGTTVLKDNRWDVHFDNIQEVEDSVSPTSEPEITNNTTVTFSAKLKNPGDKYEFLIDVVNAGTIDAMVDEVNITPELTEEQQNYFEYQITYKNKSIISKNELLSINTTKTLRVLFKYKENEDNSLYPGDNQTFNVSITVKYIQKNENAVDYVGPNPCTYAGELTQGAEYINNQYTYHYKQEGGSSTWTNIENDGWGVILTDKTSTNPVNTQLCSSINGKPIVSTSYMFASSTTGIYDISTYDTSNVTNMKNMFSSAGKNAEEFKIIGLDKINTSSVTNMHFLLSASGRYSTSWDVGDLSNFDVSNVTNISGMFTLSGYSSVSWSVGDLSNWDVSNVARASNVFTYAGYSSTTWSIGDLSKWDVSNLKDASYMFQQAGYNSTEFDIGNIGKWDVSNVTNMYCMFGQSGYNSRTWNIGDLSNWDTSNVTDMGNMFHQAGYNATTWNSIGNLKVYASTIQQIFKNTKNARGTLEIHSNPTSYNEAFTGSSTTNGSGITVNYSNNTTNIDDIIATKSTNSNITKGSIID